MRRRNAGTIVQVGSALGYRAIPLQSAYCGGKFAIGGFTDSLRSELQHERSGIRVTMVQLPAVNTPQFNWARNKTPKRPQPMPPIHQSEPVAEAIFRASQLVPRELWVGFTSVRAILVRSSSISKAARGAFLTSAPTIGRAMRRSNIGFVVPPTATLRPRRYYSLPKGPPTRPQA